MQTHKITLILAQFCYYPEYTIPYLFCFVNGFFDFFLYFFGICLFYTRIVLVCALEIPNFALIQREYCCFEHPVYPYSCDFVVLECGFVYYLCGILVIFCCFLLQTLSAIFPQRHNEQFFRRNGLAKTFGAQIIYLRYSAPKPSPAEKVAERSEVG